MKTVLTLLIAVLFVGCSSKSGKSPNPVTTQPAGFIETSTSPTIESLNREQTLARYEDVKAQIMEIDSQMLRAQERIKKAKTTKTDNDRAMAAEAERAIPGFKEEKAQLLNEKKALEAELSTVN